MYFPYIKFNYKAAIYFTIIVISATYQLNVNNIALADTFEEKEEYTEKLREQEERIEKLNQQIKEMRLQHQIINEKKGIAETQRAAAEAYLPKFNNRHFREGDLEAEDVTFESEILAVRAMDSVAKQIKTEIVDKFGSKVTLIVSDKKELLSIILEQFEYRTFKDKVDSIKRKYREFNVVIPSKRPVRTRGGGSIINPATAATASFLFDTLPIFRVNREIKQVDVDVATREFIAQLGGKFQESGDSQVSIYYPAEYPLINKDAVNDVFKEIIAIRELQNLAKKKIVSSPNEQLEELNDSVDKFIKHLIDTSSHEIESASGGKYTQTKSTLQRVISSRALELITDSSDKTYFLSVDVLAKGSQRKTETFLSNRLRHSGGVIVKYIIFDRNASIVLSNVRHSYTGFSKVRTSK